ncbi:hypothetical protein GX645_01545 [Candidatus Sumerlaeota bacterium]|nr:hypothetical protein [Candidatus Sumerlaeota bacterium]
MTKTGNNRTTRAAISLPFMLLLLVGLLSGLCLWSVLHFAKMSDDIAPIAMDDDDNNSVENDVGATTRNKLVTSRGPSSEKTTRRLSANEAAKRYYPNEFVVPDADASTTCAALYRESKNELAQPGANIAQSKQFAELVQALKNEHNMETRTEMEMMIRANIKDYIKKQRTNNANPFADIIDMMKEEQDVYMRDIYAQALAENITPEEVAALLTQWEAAAQSNNEAEMESIGAIMAKCSDAGQLEHITKFIAENPSALQYVGAGPDVDGSALGAGVILDTFEHLTPNTPEAAEFAAQLDKYHGAQAVVSLDAVLNMPRDEEQRVLAANVLAAIGSPDAVSSLGETLCMAQTEEEIVTLMAALSSVSSEGAIGTLLTLKASENATPQLIEACDKALSHFTQEQIQKHMPSTTTDAGAMTTSAPL